MAFLAIVNFGFVRIALLLTLHALPDYPIRPRQNFRRDRLADLLGGLERLMTSSNFIGCSTGKSAGLVPFQNLVDENRGALKNFDSIGIVGGEVRQLVTPAIHLVTLMATGFARQECGNLLLVTG